MCIKHRWTFQSQLQVNVHWVASQILYLIHFNVNSRELFTRTSLWITEHNNCLKPQKAAHFSFKFLGSILPAVRHCHGVFPRSKSLTRGKQTPKLERERERERERQATGRVFWERGKGREVANVSILMWNTDNQKSQNHNRHLPWKSRDLFCVRAKADKLNTFLQRNGNC